MELEELLDAAEHPGFFLRKTLNPNDPGAAWCWLGGAPTMPDDIVWPVTKEAYSQPSIPLHFVAQIDLASIPRRKGLPAMPQTGTLFFFYDPIFGPNDDFRNDNAQIIYVADDVSGIPERKMPDLPSLDTLVGISDEYESGPYPVLNKWNFNFENKAGFDTYRFDADAGNSEVYEKRYLEEARIEDLSKADVGQDGRLADRSLHCMFAGPTFDNDYDREPPSDRLHNRVPLLAISRDYDLGVYVGSFTWGVVFWVDVEKLLAGDFSSIFAMPCY